MWSWLSTLRSCFGNTQNARKSSSPEPFRANLEGPLAIPGRHDLVPALPTAQATRSQSLQWGQNRHPKTPGSQREQVLRPLGPSSQHESASGLRSRHGPTVGFAESSLQDLGKESSGISVYHSPQSPGHDQTSLALAQLSYRHQGVRHESSQDEQVEPVNLQFRLSAETHQSGHISEAHRPARQRLPDKVPASSKPSGRQAMAVEADSTISGQRSSLRGSPLGSAKRTSQLSSRQESPLRSAQQLTPVTRPNSQAERKTSSYANQKLSQSPQGVRQSARGDPGPASQRSTSPHPANLKRKSGNISASPAQPRPGIPSRLANSQRQSSPSAPGAPRSTVLQADSNRAAPRARLIVNASGDGTQCLPDRQINPLSQRDIAGNITRKGKTNAQPWVDVSPSSSKAASPRHFGKENEAIQLTDRRITLSSPDDPLNHSHAPSKTFQMPESPGSQQGNSPTKCRFMFSNDSTFGTPSIVGVHNQDEEYREDKSLKVHKTPFDIRVDRLIEKEQAYKQLAALKRRTTWSEPV